MIKPFWAVEQEYLHEYDNFVYDCERAYNLRDALACGANNTYLDGEEVGWLEEGGGFFLNEKFKMSDEELEKIKVEFEAITTDLDGFAIAYYNRVKGE